MQANSQDTQRNIIGKGVGSSIINGMNAVAIFEKIEQMPNEVAEYCAGKILLVVM